MGATVIYISNMFHIMLDSLDMAASGARQEPIIMLLACLLPMLVMS